MVSVAGTSHLTVRLLLELNSPLELRSWPEPRQSLQGVVLRIGLDIRKLRTFIQMINGSGMSRAETTAGTTSTGRSNMDDFRAASVVVMSFTLREAVHSGLGLADSSSVLPNRITRSAMIGSGIAIRS